MENSIAFVMTWRVGISEWEMLGISGRETKLWKEYYERGWNVWVVTSSKNDSRRLKEIKEKYPDFKFLTFGLNSLKIQNLNEILIFCIRSRRLVKLGGKVVVRTNQLLGSHIGVIMQLLSKAQLIIRQGFNAVDNTEANARVENYKIFFLKTYEKIFVRTAHSLEFTSVDSAKRTLERTNVKKQCAVIPNFVDLELWERDSETKYPNKRDKLVIGFFGRLEEEKNLLNLMAAVAQINGVELVIIGNGSLQEEICEIAQIDPSKFKISNRKTQEEIVSMARQWDFAVFPSLFEGNPKAILEMLCLGVPVLATNVRGINEIVIHGENGFLVDGIDVDNIVELLEQGKKSSFETRAKLSLNGQRLIAKKYGLKSIVESQIQTYGGEPR
jgi:glycosyltransferase involved in cell wall biosynthesis